MLLDVRNPKKMLAEQEDDLRRKVSSGQQALNLKNDPAFQAAIRRIDADVQTALETADDLDAMRKAQLKREALKEILIELNFMAADGRDANDRLEWFRSLVKKRKAN